MNKPAVVVYVQPAAESTQILTKFIAKHIDQINEHLIVKLIKVNGKNVQLVKSKGIERTPTLVYAKKKYVSLEKIIRILTPPSNSKDHYGYGNTSSDDLVHAWHDSILNTGDDEPDEDDPDNRANVLRQKMAAFQKRRPEMRGVETTAKIKGGRKIKPKTPAKSKFDTDADFIRASKVNDVEHTPIKRYMDEADGDLILEDYYLEEANRSGKKVGKVVSKRR